MLQIISCKMLTHGLRRCWDRLGALFWSGSLIASNLLAKFQGSLAPPTDVVVAKWILPFREPWITEHLPCYHTCIGVKSSLQIQLKNLFEESVGFTQHASPCPTRSDEFVIALQLLDPSEFVPVNTYSCLGALRESCYKRIKAHFTSGDLSVPPKSSLH